MHQQNIQRVEPDIMDAEQWLSNKLIYRFSNTSVPLFYLSYPILIVILFFIMQQYEFWINIIINTLCGILLWSLAEYLIHRFIFHGNHANYFIKAIRFTLHGIHHAYPKKMSRSITQVYISLPIAACIYFLLQHIIPSCSTGIFTGFLIGYVCYTLIHDATHHLAMNHPLSKWLKIHHLKHHYFNTEKNFGVSSPIWDYVFKTRDNTKI